MFQFFFFCLRLYYNQDGQKPKPSSSKIVKVVQVMKWMDFSVFLCSFYIYTLCKNVHHLSLQRLISIAFDKTLNEKLNYSKKKKKHPV